MIWGRGAIASKSELKEYVVMNQPDMFKEVTAKSHARKIQVYENNLWFSPE